jgi:hypothetical protein
MAIIVITWNAFSWWIKWAAVLCMCDPTGPPNYRTSFGALVITQMFFYRVLKCQFCSIHNAFQRCVEVAIPKHLQKKLYMNRLNRYAYS